MIIYLLFIYFEKKATPLFQIQFKSFPFSLGMREDMDSLMSTINLSSQVIRNQLKGKPLLLTCLFNFQ